MDPPLSKKVAVLTDFVKSIFFSSNDDEQRALMTVWPALQAQSKTTEKLVQLWIACYVEVTEKIQKSHRLSTIGGTIRGTPDTVRRTTGSFIVPLSDGVISTESEWIKKKNNLLNFLNLGLSEKLLDSESKDIFRIVSIMKKSGENQGVINCLNLGLIKEVDPLLGRRSLSAKTVSEISTVDVRRDSKSRDAPLTLTQPFNKESSYEDIIEIPFKDLAYYITHVFADIIKKVTPHEFIYMALQDKCDPAFTPNLGRLVGSSCMASSISSSRFRTSCLAIPVPSATSWVRHRVRSCTMHRSFSFRRSSMSSAVSGC